MENKGSSINTGGKYLAIGLIVSALMAGCSGGGSTSSSSNNDTGGGSVSGKVTLSGTVASGLPFANQPVSIRDKNGTTASATTLADGTYSAELTNMTAPYLIKVGSLYSVATATASGTANVHPFTDMIVRNWYKVQGSHVDTAFAAAGAMPTPPTATDIATIEATVRQVLTTYMKGADVNPSGFNLITTPFNANHTGFDLVLDNLKVTQPATSGGNVTIGLTGGGSTGTILTIPETTDLTTITPPPAPVSDTVAPSAPGAITASRTGTTQVVLSWGAATDNIRVAGYKIYQNGTQVGITDQPFYIDGAAPAASACYTVAAYDAAGNSSGQNTQVCASATLVAADVTAPTAPGSLTAVASSSSQIDLSWTASTDAGGIAGYRVMVGGAAIATLPANATTYSHTGLNASTQYSYTVVAIDTSGNAALSAVASATTSAKTDTTAPTAPSGVTATAILPNTVYLTWTASTDTVGVAGYNVYSGATLAGTSVTASFIDINLTASTQYCYTVKAYDAAGNLSAASAQVCATTTAASAGSISATITALQNLYATALPSATDPNLTSLFASTFLDDGMNFAQWLPNSGFTTAPVLIGAQFTNIASTPPDAATGTVAQVQFKIFSATGADLTATNPGGVVSWQMKLNAATGTWQIDGNQKIIAVKVRSFAGHSTCGVQVSQCDPATFTGSYATGLSFDFGQTSSIGTILVTGAGLPLNGISMIPGANGWTISTANTTGCMDAWPWQWCMNDAEILNASAGSTYTVKLFDTSASPVLLATYTAVLASTPTLNTALATLTYPTLTNLPDISAGITGATLTPTWTIPTGQIGGGMGAYIWSSSYGLYANIPWTNMWGTPAGSGTASIVVPAPVSGTWNSAVWDITSTDQNDAIQVRTHYR